MIGENGWEIKETGDKSFTFVGKESRQEKSNCFDGKKQNEANPSVVCRFSSFADLITLSPCSPMSANVS